MKKPPKIYTPYERGKLGYKAGCTIYDAPDNLSSIAQKEWRDGWRFADAQCSVMKEDEKKFGTDNTGVRE